MVIGHYLRRGWGEGDFGSEVFLRDLVHENEEEFRKAAVDEVMRLRE
jgi:hypothetical protein